MPTPDTKIVSVFQANDASLLALARIALEREGIEFSTAGRGISAVFGWRARADSPGNMNAFAEVFVSSADADRARAILADLKEENAVQSATDGGTDAIAPIPQADEPRLDVELREAENGRPLGVITADDLAFLREHLELESADDDDYYVDAGTIEMLADAGANARLLDVLKQAVSAREGVDIRWSAR